MAFAVQTSEEGGVVVLALSGQLDSRTAPALERETAKALGKECHALLFDLTALDFVASAGLRVVIMVGKRLAADGGAIALCGLNASVREVFDIAGFSGLFPILPDRARAVAALAGRARLGGIGRMADRLLHRRGEPAGPPLLAQRSAADPELVALAAEILRRGAAPPK
ncbi:MAG: STAS domain-containing protein [Thermoanaerobaculia bacterium]|jgi:anti-anti-sigma factor|nr:STAS domain-containing protein [Thermoanaerobaculia bacterium]MBP9822884.1 STAS domain-containing protein [Thermoanaerobaculia bacterium]